MYNTIAKSNYLWSSFLTLLSAHIFFRIHYFLTSFSFYRVLKKLTLWHTLKYMQYLYHTFHLLFLWSFFVHCICPDWNSSTVLSFLSINIVKQKTPGCDSGMLPLLPSFLSASESQVTLVWVHNTWRENKQYQLYSVKARKKVLCSRIIMHFSFVYYQYSKWAVHGISFFHKMSFKLWLPAYQKSLSSQTNSFQSSSALPCHTLTSPWPNPNPSIHPSILLQGCIRPLPSTIKNSCF